MKRFNIFFGLPLLTLILVIVACGGSAEPQQKTLKVGVPFVDHPPDPVKAGSQTMREGLAETLFKLNKDLNPEPWLATGAEQLDESTWEITLREGVKFHNGVLMDAAAVKASLDRAIDKSTSVKVLLNVSRIEVKDPSTLTIVTNGPSPILPGLLTAPRTAIVDAAAAEAMGEAFTTKAVLTGPFKVEKFLKDEELVVVRHDDYWGPAPLVDRVIFLALADQNSRVLALQSGDIDIAAYIAPESVATVQSSSNLIVRPAAPVALDFLYLNHQKESWSDVNVRQAIAIAIDREALVEAIMLGQGAPAIGPFPPRVLGCDGLRAHNFDPAKAKQLLAEAGYQPKDGDGYLEKDGQTLTMRLVTYPQRSELIPMAEAIQAMLKDIGVKVDVRVSEQINAELEQGDWDGGMYFGGMATTGDPYRSLSRFFITGSERNFGGYSSPQVDELTRQVGESTDRQEREQLACAASQVITDDVALIPLVYPNINYGVSNQIIGFDEPHPFSLYFMDSKIGKR